MVEPWYSTGHQAKRTPTYFNLMQQGSENSPRALQLIGTHKVTMFITFQEASSIPVITTHTINNKLLISIRNVVVRVSMLVGQIQFRKYRIGGQT